ncbi:hypothetical protein C8J56DRAFT_769726 [Mycena floridula]|nr:hypothetical protein C8J56DRAFT_769726 [Mycena floridula]
MWPRLRPRLFRLYSTNRPASAQLFEDAAREEAEQKLEPPKQIQLPQQHENWTGEERIQGSVYTVLRSDAVLRMLVDKYKPLRSRTIQTAEQKMKRSLSSPSSGSWASEVLIPPIEGHRPWHTEFKAPSHAVSSIKLANIPPPVKASALPKAKEKRFQQAARLDRARESTLDYRLGLKKDHVAARPNPVSIKGSWSGLVEDKIERAQREGLFKTIKGRGQPISRAIEESNPFIAREEFLMNRIVKRNGAVPPWVELQAELESSLTVFRDVLRQSWVRRAVRNITTSNSSARSAQFTVADIRPLRDPEWEQKERGYHDKALEEVNSLVRSFNGLAPYPVRRPYYVLQQELNRMYEDCSAEICQALAARSGSLPVQKASEINEDAVSFASGWSGIAEMIRLLLGRIFAMFTSKTRCR